ncbi:putative RDD family membrane protein YckC [Mucilaginibacter gracilis]|uniref:Putative RDD family membrane protein YckC n=2 Tax=Mucilaginibacter gracilis TaxID=423350 RepID=A0A495J878_9SPHI|nr:putative RDD family membrane protein YckC [Mucilaginibacter gracilis]
MYLLVVNGKPEGPYSINELKAMQIKAADFVKTAEMDDYKEAHEIAQLRTIFGFQFQAVAPQYFGAFDQRALAAIIDWLIVIGSLSIVTLIGLLATSDATVRTILLFILAIIIIPAHLAYSIAMEGSARQATFGKKILKIQVCNMDGSPINMAKAAGRNLAKIFSVLTFFVGYLICFFNKKQQCLHDMIAGTLVTRERLI